MPVAVVTGGNKGLGLAQSRALLEDGYRVFVVARTEGEISTLPGDVEFIEHDLSDAGDVSYLDQVHAAAGRIDGLVNNAGMHLKKPVWDVGIEELGRVMDLNVRAMLMACGRYVALHRETGGAIVNISSMGGLMALPSATAYVTAKTAVIGLTRSVAIDAAQFGIRCNAVAPGFIDTDMTRAVLEKDPARRAKIEGRIPTHTFGTPENVADVVKFLLGAGSTYVNGTVIPVDGGYSVGF